LPEKAILSNYHDAKKRLESDPTGNKIVGTSRRLPVPRQTAFAPEELPLTVRSAATYLGVSVQTVYLWVERKQSPHLRVMGRNIRFLKSDLEPFRATFRQEMGNGKTE
jgi:excisionase family DNA binding protein